MTLRHFRRFLKSESGVISVETVIMFPILLWAFAAMFVFFDAFKARNTNIKATYTIADLISRTTDPVDMAYIDGLNNVYGFLVQGTSGNDLRVTVVTSALGADGVTPENRIVWSRATGDMLPHDDVDAIESIIPLMALGSQTIIVQTQTTWRPWMRFGLDERVLRSVAFTSPRFVPQVVWDATS